MTTDTTPSVVNEDGEHVDTTDLTPQSHALDDKLAMLAAITVLKERVTAAWADARVLVEQGLIQDRETNGAVKTRNVEIGGTKVGQVTLKDLNDTVTGNTSEAFMEWVEATYGADKIEYKPAVRKTFWDSFLDTVEITEDGVVDPKSGEVVPGLVVVRAPKEHGEFTLSFKKGKVAGVNRELGKEAALAAVLSIGLTDLSPSAITDGLKK